MHKPNDGNSAGTPHGTLNPVDLFHVSIWEEYLYFSIKITGLMKFFFTAS